MRRSFVSVLCLSGLLAGCGEKSAGPAVPSVKLEATAASIQQNVITPLCVTCHSSKKSADGINLEDIQAVLDGKPVTISPGSSGHHHRIIVPGCSQRSRFVQVMEDGTMPKPMGSEKKRVSPQELSVIKKWIDSAGTPCKPDLSEPGGPDDPILPPTGNG